MIRSVASGDVDMAWTVLMPTAERQQVVDMLHPYYFLTNCLVNRYTTGDK